MVVNSSTILEGYTLARKMVAGIDDDQDVDDGLVTYKWGPKHTEDYVFDFVHGVEVHQESMMGQYYPTLEGGNAPVDSLIVKPFRLVNGLPFKKFFGWEDQADATEGYIINNTHIFKTLSPDDMVAFGRQQRYTLWESVGDDDAQVYGCLYDSIIIDMQSGGKVTCSMTAKGCEPDYAVFGTSVAAPIYPMKVDGTTQVKTLFSTCETLIWNYARISKWLTVTFQGKKKLDGFIGDDGWFQSLDDQFPQICGITVSAFEIPAGIRADHLAKTPHDFTWRVTKGNRDTITGASDTVDTVTTGAKTVLMTALAGTLNQYAGDILKVESGTGNRMWYRIISNDAATPTTLTLYETPADFSGEDAYITDDTTEYFEITMYDSLIADYKKTKTKFGLVLYSFSVISQNVRIRCKDMVRNLDIDEPTE